MRLLPEPTLPAQPKKHSEKKEIFSFSCSQVPLGNTVLTAPRSVIRQFLYSQESAPVIVCKQGQPVNDGVG